MNKTGEGITIHRTVRLSSSNAESNSHVFLTSETTQDRDALARLRLLADQTFTNTPRITRVPGMMGGHPIVDGMRVRVSDIVREHHSTGDARIAMPFLTVDQILTALAYYYANQLQIDAEIAEEDAAAEQCRPDST